MSGRSPALKGPQGDRDWVRAAPTLALRGAYYQVAMRGLAAAVAPTDVLGLELIGGNGPFVVVSNHSSHADTMVIGNSLPTAIRKRLVVGAAADYFFTNLVTSTFSAVLVGAIPVDRTKVSRSTLDLCHRLLGEGWSLLLYPEGGRSADGSMGDFKPGAAWIARRAGVPVLPAHIRGTHDVLPKGRSIPRRAPVTVRFGAPLSVADGEDARGFNQRVRAAVAELGGESAEL